MRNVCLKALLLALTLGGLAGMVTRTEAQNIQTLIQFTNSWRYDQSGRNLGTAWRTNNYAEDAQWQGPGAGLLGLEDAPAPYVIHAPITTPLSVNNSITTYFFRTTFTFTGNTNGVVLIATNLVDDGCAIWLNGRLAGGVRMPAGYNNNPTTLFGGPAAEGQLDVVTLTNFLRSGANANLLAVEVHQSAIPSSDIMFGMKLLAFVPTMLAITNHPDNQIATVGDTATFEVGVSGGPVTYRWFKDGVLLPSATGSILSIPNVQAGSAGSYRVVVSNIVNVVTSTVATLTVVADTDGPRMLTAIWNNAQPGTTNTFGTNTINITFDEAVNGSTTGFGARNPNNYRLVSSTNPTNQIPILSVLYNTGLGALLTFEGTNANWNPNGDYYLLVNNIADTRGNNIAPNSVIGLSFLLSTNLTQMSQPWDFFVNGFDFPDIYADAWYGTNYIPGADGIPWGNGGGLLFIDPNPPPTQVCSGDTPQTLLSFQNFPTLFRRTFTLAPGLPSSGSFRFRFVVDDGMILYLNGREIHRQNVGPGTWNQNTRALANVTDFGCVTFITNVAGLHTASGNRMGTNVFGAAIFQSTTPESDTWFGLEMDFVTLRTSPVPTNRPPGTPTLVRSRLSNPSRFVISWPSTNYGYNLMYSTDLSGNTWLQVPDQTNPYTNALPPTTGPRRFYKLFRERLN